MPSSRVIGSRCCSVRGSLVTRFDARRGLVVMVCFREAKSAGREDGNQQQRGAEYRNLVVSAHRYPHGLFDRKHSRCACGSSSRRGCWPTKRIQDDRETGDDGAADGTTRIPQCGKDAPRSYRERVRVEGRYSLSRSDFGLRGLLPRTGRSSLSISPTMSAIRRSKPAFFMAVLRSAPGGRLRAASIACAAFKFQSRPETTLPKLPPDASGRPAQRSGRPSSPQARQLELAGN